MKSTKTSDIRNYEIYKWNFKKFRKFEIFFESVPIPLKNHVLVSLKKQKHC